jgi:hypothetical protein
MAGPSHYQPQERHLEFKVLQRSWLASSSNRFDEGHTTLMVLLRDGNVQPAARAHGLCGSLRITMRTELSCACMNPTRKRPGLLLTRGGYPALPQILNSSSSGSVTITGTISSVLKVEIGIQPQLCYSKIYRGCRMRVACIPTPATPRPQESGLQVAG